MQLESDHLQEAQALRLLARRQQENAAMEDAAGSAKRACALFEEVGDEAALCETLIELALLYVQLGLHDDALETVTRSLNLAISRDDRRMIFWGYNRTGVVHGSLGDAPQAQAFLLAGLAMAEDLESYENFCIRNNLADNAPALIETYRGQGDEVAAATCLSRGLDYASAAVKLGVETGYPYREALARLNWGRLLSIAEDLAGARAQFALSQELAQAHRFAGLAICCQQYAACATLRAGHYSDAIPQLHDVLKLRLASGEKPAAAEIHLLLSEAYENTGETALALRHYKAHHAVQRSFNTDVAQTRSRLLSNMIALQTSQHEAEKARQEAAGERSRRERLEAEKLQLQQESEDLSRHAHQDALTGLWNRRYIGQRLQALVAQMQQTGRPLCIALADIDHFKTVNDRFGHAMGDQVLISMAGLLRGALRPADIVARYGGEEFLLLFPDTDLAAASAACERVRAAVGAHDWQTLQPGLQVTMSLGVTAASGADFAAALYDADTLLYQAKQAGRNQVRVGELQSK
jgi:diguanylate cyclase (GGDEF)-like protein